jgi:hypothetical protein
MPPVGDRWTVAAVEHTLSPLQREAGEHGLGGILGHVRLENALSERCDFPVKELAPIVDAINRPGEVEAVRSIPDQHRTRSGDAVGPYSGGTIASTDCVDDE